MEGRLLSEKTDKLRWVISQRGEAATKQKEVTEKSPAERFGEPEFLHEETEKTEEHRGTHSAPGRTWGMADGKWQMAERVVCLHNKSSQNCVNWTDITANYAEA